MRAAAPQAASAASLLEIAALGDQQSPRVALVGQQVRRVQRVHQVDGWIGCSRCSRWRGCSGCSAHCQFARRVGIELPGLFVYPRLASPRPCLLTRPSVRPSVRSAAQTFAGNAGIAGACGVRPVVHRGHRALSMRARQEKGVHVHTAAGGRCRPVRHSSDTCDAATPFLPRKRRGLGMPADRNFPARGKYSTYQVVRRRPIWQF